MDFTKERNFKGQVQNGGQYGACGVEPSTNSKSRWTETWTRARRGGEGKRKEGIGKRSLRKMKNGIRDVCGWSKSMADVAQW